MEADEIKLRLEQRQLKYIWITGHSLGGAMATCCAHDWVTNKLQFSGLVTFGQPRVGNSAMARFLDGEIGDRYVRFVNEDDLVPLLPPGCGILLPDYWHCGARIRFRNGELDRRNGITIISAPSPNEDATSDAPTKEVGGDGEETIAEQDLFALQQYLRSEQPSEAASELPEELRGDTPPPRFGAEIEHPKGAAIPKAESLSRDAINSLLDRVRDHSMLEYLRQLNSFRRNKA